LLRFIQSIKCAYQDKSFKIFKSARAGKECEINYFPFLPVAINENLAIIEKYPKPVKNSTNQLTLECKF